MPLNTHAYSSLHHAVLLSKTLVRPNSDLLFPVIAAKSLPKSVANVLHPAEIAAMMKTYPNRRFVDTLLSIVTSGARVGYEDNPSVQTRCPNHASAYEQAEVITDAIQNEVAHGRVKKVMHLPENYFCSSIGLRPKLTDGVQTEWRVIFDLSSPIGHSVNDGIPVRYGS